MFIQRNTMHLLKKKMRTRTTMINVDKSHKHNVEIKK